MKVLFFSILFFVLGFKAHSLPKADKKIQCTNRGCSCEGKGCSFTDNRIIKSASTVAINCSKLKNCDQKIVRVLFEKYGCKASVQKNRDEDYVVATECFVIEKDGPDLCPYETTAESIERLLTICLTIPKSLKPKS